MQRVETSAIDVGKQPSCSRLAYSYRGGKLDLKTFARSVKSNFPWSVEQTSCFFADVLRQKRTRVKSVAFREHSKGYIFVHPCSLPIMTSVRCLLGYGHTPPHCYKHYLIKRPTLCSFQLRWQILCSLHTDEPSSDLACRTGPSNIGTVSAFVSTAPPPPTPSLHCSFSPPPTHPPLLSPFLLPLSLLCVCHKSQEHNHPPSLSELQWLPSHDCVFHKLHSVTYFSAHKKPSTLSLWAHSAIHSISFYPIGERVSSRCSWTQGLFKQRNMTSEYLIHQPFPLKCPA